LSRKEESKRAADNYEHLLEEARQKLAAAQSKIDVLNEKCIQLATLKDDLTDELNEERKNHSKLHSLIKGAEQRAQNSARQIQDMLGRERELLNERKDFRKCSSQLIRH
jgi:chromosome segregation ATPase